MDLLTVMIMLALAATVISLVWGVVSMAHGGHYDEEHSTRLMGARVGFQALALVLLIVATIMSW